MKKFTLAMFVLVILSLQLPYFGSIKFNYEILLTIFEGNTGGLLMYSIPLLGIIVGVIGELLHKNLSIITALIAVFGLLFSGFIFFGYQRLGFSAGYGFIGSLLSYVLALTGSIVSVRIKE